VTATSSSGTPPAAPATVAAAWEAVLEAEQVAVYGYGVVAARLRAERDPSAEAAVTDLGQHQRRRDQARAAVQSAGGEPAAAAPAYALPAPVADAADATALATQLERACAAAYGDLVALVPTEERGRPVGWLISAADAETRWSGTVPPLPGMGDRLP
jgi:Domain of unknown function (DUF4439)